VTDAPVLVEACVESLEEALAAERGGARRLELCANMDVGGTTPGAELFRAVRAQVQIPIAMMIRPRGGSFVYSNAEWEAMRRDLDLAVELGADVAVIGVLTDDGHVHSAHTRELVARAGSMPVTFHKAFDVVEDQERDLEALIDAGVARVLTSGGADTAIEGADALSRLVERAAGRIAIMPGGKVRGNNVREIVERTGVREVHARCNTDPLRIREIASAVERWNGGTVER
jgi:copper homeostasis protein